MQAEGLVRAENLEPQRSRAVTDQRTRRDLRGGRGDLPVGDTEQHGRAPLQRVGPASERTLDRDARSLQGAGERVPHAAASDDGKAGGTLAAVFIRSVQFPWDTGRDS